MLKAEAKAKREEMLGVLVDLSEGFGMKFVAHRGFDQLLCRHVFSGVCRECPQWKCRKRSL